MQFRPGAQWRISLGIVVTFLSAAGCAPAPDHARHTVEYYRASPKERQAMVRDCKDNPGDLKRDPDCVNALEAERIEGIGSLRDLEPLQLPRSRGK